MLKFAHSSFVMIALTGRKWLGSNIVFEVLHMIDTEQITPWYISLLASRIAATRMQLAHS